MSMTDELPESQPRAPRYSIARSAGSVSLATMISRVLGVIREVVMARYFGAGAFTDAFNIAYRIPNLLRDLFAEGALSAAFIPSFTRVLTRDGKTEAWVLANLVINALAAILGLLTLLIYFGAKWFVFMLAAGFAQQPDKFELTVQMTRIMSPFLLCVALAAVVMGMLNALGVFFIPALSSSAFNVCCILAGIFLSPVMPQFGLQPIVSMAIGALVGGASQLLVQLPSAYAFGFRYSPILRLSDPGLRHIGKLMLPAILGLSATQINITVDNQLASLHGDGPVSWLNYGFRLMQLPIGVFGVAVATATLATVSRHAANAEMQKLGSTVTGSLRLAACLTFPASAGLIIFRVEIIQLLYERGSFLPGDTQQTSRVLLLYAFALFAYSAVKILVLTFYALNDTRIPVRSSMITVAAKVAVNFVLIVPLGYLGLALSTTLASWLNFLLLLRHLNRRISVRTGWRELWIYLRISAASAAMGLASLLVYQGVTRVSPLGGTTGLAAALGSAILTGMLSTIPLLRIFGVQEADDIVQLIKQKLAERR